MAKDKTKGADSAPGRGIGGGIDDVDADDIPFVEPEEQDASTARSTVKQKSALKRLVRAVNAVKCKEAGATFEIDAILQSDDDITSLSRLMGANHGLYLSCLRDLAKTQSTRATKLSHAVRALQASRTPTLSLRKVAHTVDQHPSPAIMDTAAFKRLLVPPEYEVTDTGVFRAASRGSTMLAPLPVIITARMSDFETREAMRVLAWPCARGWQRLTLPRGVMLDAHALVKALAPQEDSPISSGTAKYMVGYLLAFDALNRETIPESEGTRHLGWHRGADPQYSGSQRAFVLPEQSWAAPGDKDAQSVPPVLAVVPPAGMARVCRNMGIAGTLDGWKAFVHEHATPHPATMVLILAALASPLVRLLPKASPFVLDVSGPHGTAKTTSLRVAQSVWGAGGEGEAGIGITWNMASSVGVEMYATFMHSLPMFVDDTHKARDKGIIGDVLMHHSSGQGKIRGRRDGGLVEPGTWANILLSTGESAITDYTTMAGAVDRAICFRGAPLGQQGKEGAATARALAEGATTHYGHAGRAMAQWLSRLDDEGLEKLRALHDQHVHRWTQRQGADTSTAQRLGTHAALLTMTQEIAEKVLKLFVCRCDVADALLQTIRQADPISDRPSQALVAIEGTAVSRQFQFYGRHEPGQASRRAYIGVWDGAHEWIEVCIDPATLRRWMEDAGFADWQGIVDTWQQRGWMSAQDESSRGPLAGRIGPVSHQRVHAPKVRRSLDGEMASFYGVRRDAFAEAHRAMQADGSGSAGATGAIIR